MTVCPGVPPRCSAANGLSAKLHEHTSCELQPAMTFAQAMQDVRHSYFDDWVKPNIEQGAGWSLQIMSGSLLSFLGNPCYCCGCAAGLLYYADADTEGNRPSALLQPISTKTELENVR